MNFEKPGVTVKYCDGILNFKPDIMLKVKFAVPNEVIKD